LLINIRKTLRQITENTSNKINPLQLIENLDMRGKGFSSCLLCESEKDLLLGDKLIQKIIKLRYGTDTVS